MEKKIIELPMTVVGTQVNAVLSMLLIVQDTSDFTKESICNSN